MLEELHLINFQAHRKFTIKFDPRITTVIGTNDVGKSAILRALSWLCTNRPAGEEFRTWDTDKTVVRLKVDGHVIRRRRGKSNSYSLDSKEFRAFGSDVPAPIAKLLNITQDNFQNQFASSFWLSETPSQVGKNLNQIVNLGVIDDALSYIATENRKAKVAVEISTERLSTARDKKKGLVWILDANTALERIEKTEEELEILIGRRSVLTCLIKDVQTLEHTVSNARNKRTKGQEIVFLADAIQKLWKRLRRLEELLKHYKQLREQCQLQNERLEESKSELRKVKQCPVCGNQMS